MAQVIPPITSLPLDSSAAPSVEDIQDRLPSICVDYLSHDWSEEDVWASWRSMTRHKHEIANGLRLENASWRTWQKQRNKLKTISPETLNWLKDSDVTWLYGPLHTAAVEPVRPLRVATAEERLSLDPGVKKPILKHRTLSEMLTIHTPSSPILEATLGGEDTDAMDLDRPQLHQTKSDTNIVRSRGGMRKRSPPRMPISDKTTPMDGGTPPNEQHSANSKRHISFNTFVEQVIAVDDPSDIPQEESDDEILEMRSNSSRSSRPSLSRHSSSTSTGSDHLTIAKIAPTMLKTTGGYHASLPAMVYAPPAEYMSPGINQPSDFDFPSPQISVRSSSSSGGPRWVDEDEDEYSSVGYDYFGGPDLSGEERDGARAIPGVPSHIGAHYVRPPPPPVNQPPAQPKWRQPASSTLGAEPGTSHSSTSSSSTSVGATSPQPGRSILKVRSASSPQPPEDPPSPPSTYFNYTPSAATGFGGMRGAGAAGYDWYNPASPGPGQATSPVASTANNEERGRSTSRDRGSSAYGRSSSGSASVGSTSSMSPGAPTPRSPTEMAPNLPPQQQQSQPPPQVPINASPSAPVGQAVSGISQQLQPPAQVNAHQANREHSSERMDVDGDDDRSGGGAGTPTPHSSPQIALRPLKDTSPSSLPHTSTPISPNPPSAVNFPSNTSANPRSTQSPPIKQTKPTSPTDSQRSPEFPHIDPAKILSPPQSNSSLDSANPSFSASQSQSHPHTPAYSPSSGNAPGTSRPYNVSGRATTAHVGTNAAPTLSGGFDSRAGLQNYGQVQAQQGQVVSPTSPGGQTSPGLGSGSNHDQSPSAATPGQRYASLGPTLAANARSAQMHAQGGRSTSNPTVSTQAQAGSTTYTNKSPVQTQTYFRPRDRDLDDEEGDGSSIMGRAANIASTAKDLLGALWYGANEGQGGGAGGAQGGAVGGASGGGRHKRNQSLG